MKSKVILSLFAIMSMVVAAINAQTAEEPATWKAFYLNLGKNFNPSGASFGLTLVAPGNLFFSSQVNGTDLDAPQLPDDFKRPKVTYTDTGIQTNNEGNDCFICLNGYLSGFGGGSGVQTTASGPDPNETRKRVRLFTASVGWMYELKNAPVRFRGEAGMAQVRIKEPINFKYVPNSEEQINENYTRKITEGYLFQSSERNMMGLMVGAGIEAPLTKVIGLNASYTAAFAGEDNLSRWNVGLIIGLLR